MNKSELVMELSERMNMPQYKVREFINQLQEVMEKELLKEDGGIILQGFGTFSSWQQAERMGRNPRTGRECMIRARKSVKFKPGKYLLEALNGSISCDEAGCSMPMLEER